MKVTALIGAEKPDLKMSELPRANYAVSLDHIRITYAKFYTTGKKCTLQKNCGVKVLLKVWKMQQAAGKIIVPYGVT